MLNYGDSSRLVYVYTSLEEARKIHPDSVFGLDLVSCGLKDFPKEILNYKNLVVFDLSSYFWEQVQDSLSPKQKKKLIRARAGMPENFCMYKFWRVSTIKKIPKEIKNLKKLRYFTLGHGVRIKHRKKFFKIHQYLPNTVIYTGFEEDGNHQKNLDEIKYNLELGKQLEEKKKKSTN